MKEGAFLFCRNSCGKYHLGTCDPNRGKSTSSSSSSKTITPGKYDKYKGQDAGKKKRKLSAILYSNNDIEILQQEAHLNKLSESSYACQYPMKISTTTSVGQSGSSFTCYFV